MRYASAILGRLVEIRSGFAFKSECFNSEGVGMPLVRIRDVLAGQTSTYYDGPWSDDFVVEDGDILIGMDGEFNRARWRGGKALLNQRVCKISVSSEKLVHGFLFHFLPSALKAIEDKTPFVTVKHLSAKDIKAIEIPLPPLAEQRRIAAILDQADDLRRKRREAIEQLDRFLSAIFVSMFGDPIENHLEWARLPLGTVVESIDSGWSPVCLDRPAKDDEWGVLKLSAVTSCEYKQDEHKALSPEFLPKAGIEVRAGDLLFTRKNTASLVAACALVGKTRPRLMLSDLIFRINLKRTVPVDSVFLQSLLSHPAKRAMIQRLACGSAGSMPNISKEKLRGVEIETPPLSLQRAFAARVAEIDKLKAAHRAHLEKLDALFASLQHRAFRGELSGGAACEALKEMA